MNAVPTVAISGIPDPLPEAQVVLDVREQVEWDHGHIAGALHVPLGDLPDRLPTLIDHLAGQTLVICRVGGRSGQAVAWLAQQGFDVVNVDGGMLDWESAGRSMVSENGQPPQVV